MIEELGGLLGWLMIAAFIGTILNYCIKFANKKWCKKISSSDFGKKLMKILMKIFVRNHKYFGFLTGVFLVAHFSIQFTRFGFNLTGGLAGSLIILQVLLGMYANLNHKPRKGVWFVAHRLIALFIVLGIAVHLIVPYAF